MNLIEAFLKDNLFIDFGAEVIYGEEQIDVNYPHRIATVEFELMSTPGLSQIADRIRKDAGFVPLHPMDEYMDETCDQNGWYNFYVGINDWSSIKMDCCINFVLTNSESPDNEEVYSIGLGELEQEYVFSRLDEQCRRYLGKGCMELLNEARERMDEARERMDEAWERMDE